MAKARIKRQVIRVPQNLEEAADFLAAIGRDKREIDRTQTMFNQEIERLKAKALADIKPYEERMSQLVEGLYSFAEGRRKELTDDGKRKTVDLPTGQFSWRKTPPAVSLKKIETALADIKTKGLEEIFIRTKIIEEIDKEEMLRQPDLAQTIKGVSIGQREEFVVKPSELEVEIVSTVKKLKRAAS